MRLRPFSLRAPRKKKASFWGRLFLFLLVVGIGVFLFPVLLIWRGPMGIFLGDTPKLFHFRTLILLQNEAELRPTGGFIGAIAILEIENGRPSVSFFDSYSLKKPNPKKPAPEAIEKIFSQDEKYAGWVFRDSNFNPDFRISAQNAIAFLRNDPRFVNKTFDAVVAINFSAAKILLQQMGGETNRLWFRLQRETKNIDLHSREELKNRKRNIGEMFFKAIKNLSYFDLPRLATTIAQLADEKQIQFFFTDPALQEKVKEKKWHGGLPDGDFFAVNVSNLGAKKSDRWRQTLFFSEITVAPNREMREDFSLQFWNASEANILTDEGAFFIRLLRPLGTTLLPGQKQWKQKTRKTYEEFSQIIRLSPEEKVTAKAHFLLPDKWTTPKKEFRWERQSGSEARLFFTLRANGDAYFSASENPRCRTRESVLFCESSAKNEEVFSLRLEDDVWAPFLENAFFTNEKEIFVRFSENIAGVENILLECDGKKQSGKVVNVQKRDATVVLDEDRGEVGEFCTLFLEARDIFENGALIRGTVPTAIKPQKR